MLWAKLSEARIEGPALVHLVSMLLCPIASPMLFFVLQGV